ncbi:10404_t:CDS:10 [Paraglomus occultum]|uniref:10404_t:CDS:1 n=1 Tax=Paraglomus occultum TaxID=144539 RepID=A0A9N8ZZ58_9GLOM|nr:10404_t:CDS:10 [Paraglomus occultum]
MSSQHASIANENNYEEIGNTREEITKTLELNRAYQAELSKCIQNIEAALNHNRTIQERLDIIKQTQERSDKERAEARSDSTRCWGPPFFVNEHGQGPPELEDSNCNTVRPPVLHKYQRWNSNERAALTKGIKFINMKKEASKILAQGGKMKDLQRLSNAYLLENVRGVDWRFIAKHFVQTKTASECLMQWTNHDHPRINKSSWTKPEIAKLRAIAQRHKFRNWQAIALEVATNRTAAECFKTYVRQNSEPRKWTKEEDEILIQAVDLYGEKNWQQVASCLEDRSGQQCLHRWTKTLNPAIKRGRWTRAEDEALKDAVKLYGAGNWVKIQSYVLGRTDVKCRERWVNVLDPAVKKDPWTAEEDKLLLSLVRKHNPGNWSKISAEMDRRTDNQCWRRYKCLLKKTKQGEIISLTSESEDENRNTSPDINANNSPNEDTTTTAKDVVIPNIASRYPKIAPAPIPRTAEYKIPVTSIEKK